MSETAIRGRMQEYAAGRPASKKRPKKAWEAPEVIDFAEGWVLAFDQTFSKTGWAVVQCHTRLMKGGPPQLHIEVTDKGVIKEPPIPGRVGSDDVLQRALWMADRIQTVVDYQRQFVEVIVHEMPAVQGYRVESSLLGALGVRQAAVKNDLPVVMVSNLHMKKVLVGPQDEPIAKRHITQALNRYWPTTRGYNEDERDACALALTFLYDKKRQP